MGRHYRFILESPTSPTLVGWILGWRMFLLARSVAVSKSLWKSSRSAGTSIAYNFMDSNHYRCYIEGDTCVTWRNQILGTSIRLSSWWVVGGIRLYVTMRLAFPSMLRNMGHFGVSVAVTKSTWTKSFSRRYHWIPYPWRRFTDDY